MGETWKTNSIAVRLSREMMLDMGIVEPTAEEKVVRDASLAAFRAKVRAAWEVYPNAKRALEDLTDPGVRAVLDLHAPNESGHAVTCDHCCMDTEMGDMTDWPCETVEAIAKACGTALPDATLYTDAHYREAPNA